MAGLADLALKRAYHKPEDDIASSFYLPAVAVSNAYDRAVGYFSSTVFLVAWPSLKAFVANGGKMRLICSPVLSDDDHAAMREGYSDRANADLAESLKASFAAMMASEALMKPAVVLASLVAAGVIDCRVAWVGETAGGRPKRLFHDKTGLLTDASGNRVAFKGSMNETWPGLAFDGNLESVDVFASWRDDGERERIADETEYFERLWTNTWPGVITQSLPDSARAEIVSAADAAKWPEFIDDICLTLEQAAGWSPEAGKQGGRAPRPHQVAALEAWTDRGRRGIFEHATGSGKTFTALCAMNDGFRRGDVPLVLVPSDLLLKQWDAEIGAAFSDPGVQLLICGGGHADWRADARLRSWTRPTSSGARPRAILSTLQTATSPAFLGLVSGGSHLFMIADEVHRLGAIGARQIFTLDTGARLGLSATPRRAGDPEGTKAILDYFEGVVPPPFTLMDAVAAGALTPYAYHAHPIRLESDEQARWLEVTERIRRLSARSQGDADGQPGLQVRLKLLLIQRARIVKGARRKVEAATAVLSQHFRPGQHWIVYCDDQGQLGQVKAALRSRGIPDVHEYHSAMIGDRARTLAFFNERGGTVVSIRCLDEGVDIPAVSHALILASSRNPREFIQRRGRVLRRYPGKALAHIHDVIVTPDRAEEGDDLESMLTGELVRAIEFGSNAINPGCVADLKRLAAQFGIDFDTAAGGFEVDDDEPADLEKESIDA
ncbi:DEAD/DEAH box helicase family protein [Mesorhizobium sp.]|uniref:DEAD/DEAH box helicase family protein n=1 Tax=Mesorhizobium sp. TaxID=1871066 RepID=UPI000FE91F24|nr:DEAD/DEAH box helicase family protein [Mesorhizobium sp.]RWI36081.1 MAG: type III restriction endonuclease subunit R [Mesorhizobium sp.]